MREKVDSLLPGPLQLVIMWFGREKRLRYVLMRLTILRLVMGPARGRQFRSLFLFCADANRSTYLFSWPKKKTLSTHETDLQTWRAEYANSLRFYMLKNRNIASDNKDNIWIIIREHVPFVRSNQERFDNKDRSISTEKNWKQTFLIGRKTKAKAAFRSGGEAVQL